MTVSVFDSTIYGGLFADTEVAVLFSDRVQVQAMLRVEAALARAEARCGLIPADTAERVAAAAESMDPDPTRLEAATARDGVPVTGLVELLRETAGADAEAYVHWGATSQDIYDTALVLRLREAITSLDSGLERLAQLLLGLAGAHEDTPMLARTRFQAAVPTSFGLKAAGWTAPLLRHRERLSELKPRLLVVQLGGAAGTQSMLDGAGMKVSEQLARELNLGNPILPWHSQRDALVEFAGWLSLVTGSIAKLGQDILLMAQSEIAELRIEGGGSSAMPHKTNPVDAEILLALARNSSALVGEMYQSLVHAHERDGAAWSSEWIALPQLVVGTAAALDRAGRMIDALTVDTDRMARNLAATNGLVLAESAVRALVEHMPRREAEGIVKTAAANSRAGGKHLLDELAALTDAPVDWEQMKAPAALVATARMLVRDFMTRAR